MNTIHTTSKNLDCSYTVIGGHKKIKLDNSRGLALIVLNRGERLYKEQDFLNYLSFGFDKIISIEPINSFYEVENFSSNFPSIKFLIPHQETSTGQLINLAINECAQEFVLVIWNDMVLGRNSLPKKFLNEAFEEILLCRIPFCKDSNSQVVPTIAKPLLSGNKLKVFFEPYSIDSAYSLLPYDFCGLYNKTAFIELGGFDSSFTNPYWQKLDFGFRAYLWGYNIKSSVNFAINYQGEIPTEDSSITEDYRMFYLKNLLVRVDKDQGKVSFLRFLSFYLRSGSGFFKSYAEYKKVKSWIKLNRFRFSLDANKLADLWENLNEHFSNVAG